MKYQLYTKSLTAWDGMLESLRKAKKNIFMEMYMFEDDLRQSHEFIDVLAQKADAGLKVIVIADSYGSKELGKNSIEKLKKYGVEFLFFSHWLRHIHRKILIIDEKIAFIGGVNIGKRFKNWDDLQLKVQGKIAKTLLRSFSYTYEMAGGKNKDLLAYRYKKISYKLKFWLVEHLPGKNIHTLKRHYIERITQAQKSIRIITPYFMPPRWLISLLDNAIRRNVRVEILIPKKSSPSITNRVNMHYIRKTYPLGIHFYLTPKMNHAKLLIIDNQEALIGSQNLDLLSFAINAEVGIFFRKKNIIQEVSRIYDQWKNDATIFIPKKYRNSISDYLIIFILKIFRPIL